MKENKIDRRRMIKLASLSGLSATVFPFISKAAIGSTSLYPENDNVPVPGSNSDLCFTSAADMATLLRTKKISAREVMKAHLAQIAKVNAKVNAIVTLVPEDQLMANALAADNSIAKGKILGPLHGL